MSIQHSASMQPTRRQILAAIAGTGIGSAVFQRALATQAEKASAVTPEMIRQAEWIAGLQLSEEDRKTAAGTVNQLLRSFESMRKVPLDNSVAPALLFNPAPWMNDGNSDKRGTVTLTEGPVPARPADDEALAFLTVADLSRLLAARRLTSLELTQLYLKRLKRFDPALRCVVSLTEELALKQADAADRELAAGKRRGPLHGIPWGAKDLMSVPGYKTTWGATPFKEQSLNTMATVARRLEEAGAVLVAKLTLGALAQGDKWFGGMTRNPWNPKQGSSGSSAGSASATAAGLVGFAIGTETLGSIVSPCRVCGTSGLRPTFGRVSRHGCMALSWSMDKVGPICRSLEDCALVFGAIHGRDDQDPTTVDRPFAWPPPGTIRGMRVGYFEGQKDVKDRPELAVLKDLGVQLVPISLPDKLPIDALYLILTTEASAAFDDLTRKGVKEGLNTWPRTFQQGEFVPAVEYLRANRIRTLLMKQMEEVMTQVDCYVGGNDLVLANLTGNPTIVMPNGFTRRGEVETPTAITFTGRLFGETNLLAVGHAYQQATGHHRRHPDMARVTVENAGG